MIIPIIIDGILLLIYLILRIQRYLKTTKLQVDYKQLKQQTMTRQYEITTNNKNFSTIDALLDSMKATKWKVTLVPEEKTAAIPAKVETKPILFTTEDGVEIHTGDKYVYFDTSTNYCSDLITSGGTNPASYVIPRYKYFSTLEFAQKWIDSNKTLFTTIDGVAIKVGMEYWFCDKNADRIQDICNNVAKSTWTKSHNNPEDRIVYFSTFEAAKKSILAKVKPAEKVEVKSNKVYKTHDGYDINSALVINKKVLYIVGTKYNKFEITETIAKLHANYSNEYFLYFYHKHNAVKYLKGKGIVEKTEAAPVKEEFKVGDSVVCIDITTDFNDCAGTSNGHHKWRNGLNVGQTYKIMEIYPQGIHVNAPNASGYINSPSAFVLEKNYKKDAQPTAYPAPTGKEPWTILEFMYNNDCVILQKSGVYLSSNYLQSGDSSVTGATLKQELEYVEKEYPRRFINKVRNNSTKQEYTLGQTIEPFMGKSTIVKFEILKNNEMQVHLERISDKHKNSILLKNLDNVVLD